MIASRDALLTAIRRAEITPEGLTVGPLVWLKGKALCYRRVTTEPIRRELLNKIKLASSRNFLPEIIWEINDVRQKSSRPTRTRK